MPYRVKISDTVVECDTADEAIELLNIRRSSISLPILSVVGDQPLTIKTHAMSSKREPRVSNNVTDFLFALKDVYPGPLTSEELAKRLGTTPKGLPAIVVGIRVLFRRWGVEFEDMIDWSKRVEGENIVRQYKLTRFGLETLNSQYGASDQEVGTKGQDDLLSAL
jgi:hypothetical protein